MRQNSKLDARCSDQSCDSSQVSGDASSARDVIAESLVPGTKSVFFLGCFEDRVTLYSQQVRALNLVAAILSDKDMLRDEGRVAIVGAGAGGITAAMAFSVAMPNLQALDVFDAESDILHLQTTSDRFLHPHNYDWPDSASRETVAGLPLLNWEADSARNVRKHLKNQFEEHAAHAGSAKIKLNMQHSIIRLESEGWDVRLLVKGISNRDFRYDVVILAIGFGLERHIGLSTPSYWSHNGFAGAHAIGHPDPHVFISGNGDGGLVDFMTVAFNELTHPEICNLLTSQQYDGALQEVMAVEHEAWKRQINIRAAYIKRVIPKIPPNTLRIIRDKLRPGMRVTLHTNERRLFKPQSSILNRLGSAMLLEADKTRLNAIVGVQFEGGAPSDGQIRLEGHEPIDATGKLFRLGADKYSLFAPFGEQVKRFKKRKPHLAVYRPATPSLTSDARERFGRFKSPPRPKVEIRGKRRFADEKFKPAGKTQVERLGKRPTGREQRPSVKPHLPIVEAADTAETVLAEYVDKLIAKFRYLPTQALLDGGSLRIELEKVYIALRATGTDFAVEERLHAKDLLDRTGLHPPDALSERAIDELDAQVIRERFRPGSEPTHVEEVQAVGQLFRKHRRMVILGGPGSGKSTLGRWIALQCARGLQKELAEGRPARVLVPRDQVDPTARSDDETDLVDMGPARLPIFLSVSNYANELGKGENARRSATAGQSADPDGSEPVTDLLDFLGRDPDTRRLVGGISAEGCNALFRKAVESGKAIIILDGLDELRDGSRRSVTPRIHDFIERYLTDNGDAPHQSGGNQLIITSRYTGYNLARIAECEHFGILPMQPRAVERFARAWGQAVNARLVRRASPQFDVAGFLAEIGRPRVMRLAINPLLVTILATIYHKGGALPEHRAQIYARMVDNLLAIWLSRPECERLGLKREVLLEALEPLAADLQQNASANGLVHINRLAEIASQALHSRYGAEHSEEVVDALLTTIRKHVGILAEQSNELYGFFHRTFQEFLAARHLLADPKAAPQRIAERLGDALWREPLLLAIEHALTDWGPAELTQLLDEVLALDDGGTLIPSAVLTVVAAAPEGVGLPTSAFDKVVASLVDAYGRCLGSGSSGRLQKEIETAFERLRNGSSETVTRAFLTRLGNANNATTEAVLAARLGWRSLDIVEALVDALPHDRPELDWPIRRSLAFLLPNGPWDRPESMAGRRLQRRLRMRQSLLSNASLVTFIRGDAGWLRLVVALYGGVGLPSAAIEHEQGNGPHPDAAEFRCDRAVFDPATIVTDVQNVALRELIADALFERRPVSDLITGLDEIDADPTGEVTVARAALGSDILPELTKDLSSGAPSQRTGLVLRHFAWLASSLPLWLSQSSDTALRTLPTDAPERERLDLLRAAVETLLTAGAEPSALAEMPWDELVGSLSDRGRVQLLAERWACTLVRPISGQLANRLLATSNVDDLIAAWALLTRTGALRSPKLGRWASPCPIMNGAPRHERALAMLQIMDALPDGAAKFVAGQVLGRCYGQIRDHLDTSWMASRTLLRGGPEFRAGFRAEVAEVRVTEIAVAALRPKLSRWAMDAVSKLPGPFSNGPDFINTAKNALGDENWERYANLLLFWIAPGELDAQSAHEMPSEPDDVVDVRASVGEGQEENKPVAALGWADNVRIWLARCYASINDDELPPLGDLRQALEQIHDEDVRSELIEEARMFGSHKAIVIEAVDAVAKRVRDPWLRHRATGRTSRLIEAYAQRFEAQALVWRLYQNGSKPVAVRAGPESGRLIWSAAYLYTLALELGALDSAGTRQDGVWQQLLSTDAERALAALVTAGQRDGLQLGLVEASIIDTLMRRGDTARLRDLWPLLVPGAGSAPIIARWADSSGPAGQWARLVDAEQGRLRPATVKATMAFLDGPSDRMRMRAELALHGKQPHYFVASNRWSIRTAGAEAYEMVARKVVEGAISAAMRTTLHWVTADLIHDDVEAMKRWIANADTSPSVAVWHWIIRHIDWPTDEVLQILLDGISQNPSASLQGSLLSGLCRCAYSRSGIKIPNLTVLGDVPLQIRSKEAQIPEGAPLIVGICHATATITDKHERLEEARKMLSQKKVWIDNTYIGDIDKLRRRLSEIGKAQFTDLSKYWTDAQSRACELNDRLDAITFLFLWLDAERHVELPDPQLLSHILNAIEAVADTTDQPIIAASDIHAADWEPALAEWAELMPDWRGRMASIQLLSRLRRVTPRVVQPLASALADVDMVQRAAFTAAKRFRAVDGDILPAAVRLLDGPSAGVTAAAARFLVGICAGDGEFVDRQKVFKRLQAAAAKVRGRAVYMHDDPIKGPLGFHFVDRLDRILNDAAFEVGRF